MNVLSLQLIVMISMSLYSHSDDVVKDPRYTPITKEQLIAAIGSTKRDSEQHLVLITRAAFVGLGKTAFDEYSRLSRSAHSDPFAHLHRGLAAMALWDAIHFGSEYPNELEFSSLVANHCRTQHHIIELPGRTIRDTLSETMAMLDDPIGDPLTTPNLILARTAAQYAGITLNGEGGDPCFGGPKNLPMLLHELYAPHESRESAYLRSFQKCYDDLPRLLKPDVTQVLKGEPAQEAFVAQWLDDERVPDYLDRLMLMNVHMKGADQILTKVNNVSNAAGIVSRSPLFDRRIVEAGFAIPAEYKLMGAVEKAVLKEAAIDLLPEAILLRPKSGMLVPVQRWFKKELRSYARGMLLSRRSRIRPYLEQDMIKEWLAYEGGPWPRQGVKLWLVLALEAWLRAHEG